MKNVSDYITVDPEIQNGQPVFTLHECLLKLYSGIWKVEFLLMNFWKIFQV